MEREKHVDESWKDNVGQEKEKMKESSPGACEHEQCQCGHDHAEAFEVNFVNYISSLAFQALIFLGELPNPMNDNAVEKNLPQAKFLIDTLLLIREKTKGNLSQEEDNLLSTTVYELQMKFVEILQKEKS